MLKISFVFLCHFLLIAVAVVQLRSEGQSYSSKQNVVLDIRALRESQKAAGEIASFPHVRELKAAIASNEKRVTLTSKSAPKDVPTSFKNLQEMLSHSTSETKTVLDLKDDISFHSLNNDDNSLSVEEISDTHTILCGAAQKNIGDVMFASGEIFSSNARLLKESSVFSTFMQEKVATKHHGDDARFVLLRRVLAVTPSTENGASCFNYETENVHPLDILKAVDITTSTQVPVHLSSSSNPKKIARDRSLITNDWIDPSLHNCRTDKKDFPAAATYDTADMYAVYELASSTPYMCGDFGGPTSGSLGANYDFTTKKASNPTIDLGSGFTCQDCYAFVGSNILTHVELVLTTSTSTTIFGAEVQVSGGAGFNIDLVLSNPNINSLTAPITTVLIAPSTAYATILTIDQKTASTLDYEFGGMNSVLTAKVDATGSASFATSATLDASIGAVYTLTANTLTIPVTHTDQVHAPLITNSLVFKDELKVRLELPIKFNFKLSALYGLLTCTSNVDVIPFIDYSYSVATPSTTCTTAAEPADLTYGLMADGGLGVASINLVEPISGTSTSVYTINMSKYKSAEVVLATYADCATTAGSGTTTSGATSGPTANIAMAFGLSVMAVVSFIFSV